MKDMNRCDLLLQYNFTFQDNMNRQLNCMISRSGDSAGTLAEELVLHGFIHTLDSSLIQVTSGVGGEGQGYKNTFITLSVTHLLQPETMM